MIIPAETFRGKACAFGHVGADGLTERYVSTRHCRECTMLRALARKRPKRLHLEMPAVRSSLRISVPDVEYRFETPGPQMPTREMMMRRR